MWLLLLEALGAGLLLALIVWWTMFSGRAGGERQAAAEASEAGPPSPSPAPASTRPGAPSAAEPPPPTPPSGA